MRPRPIKWLPLLMVITIAGIAAFQVYWLQKTYEREQHGLERMCNFVFRETVFRLQASRLKLDWMMDADSTMIIETASRRKTGKHMERAESNDRPIRFERAPDDKMANLVSVLSERMQDTTTSGLVVLQDGHLADSTESKKIKIGRRNRLRQFLYDVDSAQDTLQVAEINLAFSRWLEQQNIDVPFRITRKVENPRAHPEFNEVTLGFAYPVTYKLELGKVFPYIFSRILTPVLLSLVIVGLTVISFALLYRNLQRQRRLAEIKNDFISNITHELKTPIATVSVAIEALRNFNARMDVEKSNEYLDISANELQRLSLLVDKVLKLSMFEKQEIELRYEPLDLRALVEEVTTSMRLQSEKYGAQVALTSNGDTTLEADRLHLVSVIFNLLDNALKYSDKAPVVAIHIEGEGNKVALTVTDNGIGIPPVYRDKVFEKFFRVPTGNLHNTKGYGLGLSYVAHVVKRHKGTINVEEVASGGTRFSITLPKKEA